jgi:hypothetical protein
VGAIRGALDATASGTTPAEVVVSPAPPLHRFFPKCQPSRARTGVERGKNHAKEEENRFNALSSCPRTGCGDCHEDVLAHPMNCERAWHVNLSTDSPILFGEITIDGYIPEEISGIHLQEKIQDSSCFQCTNRPISSTIFSA